MQALKWWLGNLQRYWPELASLAVALSAQVLLARWALEEVAGRRPVLRRVVKLVAGAASVWVFLGFFFTIQRFAHRLPEASWAAWLRGMALAWALATVAAAVLWFLWRRVPRFDPRRRKLLQGVGGALVAAPFAGLSFGILVERTNVRVREVKAVLPGLPKDLEGLRLALLSDLHLSPFLSAGQVARAVAMANELRPHLALVTGDLVTWRAADLEPCLEQLAKLRAEAGVLGCLGNHEAYVKGESFAAMKGASLGLEFLRGRSQPLRFGAGVLNVAGVDYQSRRSPYLRGAERWIQPGAVNVLLSHNPDVFPVAARQGYQLTLSGHTHGGQLAFELFDQQLCVARFFTPYVYGLYREGPAAIYVTRGIGTVGIPARLGAPPEVALIRLCATSS